MQIAILGAGNVGKSLGNALKAAGHSVTWGVRDPSDPKHAGLNVDDIATAARGAEVVMLAVPWSAAESTVRAAGSLAGKILVDAINPIASDFSGLADLGGKSAGELVAGWATGALTVKAFNTIGNNIMENPLFGDQRASLLIAGDDGTAKATVSGLATDVGFDPVDAGPLAMAKYIEAFAWVWISLAVKQGQGREIVFKLLHR